MVSIIHLTQDTKQAVAITVMAEDDEFGFVSYTKNGGNTCGLPIFFSASVCSCHGNYFRVVSHTVRTVWVKYMDNLLLY